MNQKITHKEHVDVAVIGTSGHGSAELIQLLASHPHARITALATGNKNNAGKSVAEIRTELDGVIDIDCELLQPEEIADRCDIAIATTPDRVSLQYVPGIVAARKKCIDFSGAYRLHDPSVFQQYYGIEHTDPDNLDHAVYGLPELFREKIKDALLVANPGCYSTASLLGIAPALNAGMVDTRQPVIIRAISGYSGAGVSYRPTTGIHPYKIAKHKHTPEIAQVCDDYLLQCSGKQSNVTVSFAPRINDDMERGIDADISAIISDLNDEELRKVFQSFYESEVLVEVLKKEPDVRDVVKKNGAQVAVWKENNLLHSIVVIDNIRKGAASQAVQNLNIMFGFEETTGLSWETTSHRDPLMKERVL